MLYEVITNDSSIPSTPQGAATGSKKPTITLPPASSRMYALLSGLRRIGSFWWTPSIGSEIR